MTLSNKYSDMNNISHSLIGLSPEGVINYLENGGDATIVDTNGNTLAHTYPYLVKELVEAGCDVNRLNNDGYSPLMVAILRDDELVSWDMHPTKMGALADLVEETAKENLNRIYPNGETILTSYLSQNRVILDEYEDGEILPVLLKMGADVNQPNAQGKTPIECCNVANKEEVVSVMLPYGVKLDGQNESGKTLLMEALEEENEAFARLLLKNGANVRKADKKGDTALHYAARAGLIEIIPVMVKAGAQPWVANKVGKTPSYYTQGIAREYLRMIELSCAGDYEFHSGFTYNPTPKKIISQPAICQKPDNQNTIK